MSSFNERLPIPLAEKAQIWIVGTREQVAHLIDEFYVRHIATDRTHFTPIVPAPFAEGKFMSVLVR
jgi:alkanesulfonate monooxygenase SsuD/methylene tetrahydromethanopterin reductase-like flavin-dependent oxidoreductase (luciferase family)